ncbi:MAG: UvrD-helicase domain-containing protein [SAR324 cluster bacterium]|nr:UvrD-helicase domain-containing protein [SAR324 cluster bacterium]
MKNNNLPVITLISASAGTGKTYTLVKELTEAVLTKRPDDRVRPEAIIATTYTRKAANELKQRIRTKFLEQGRFMEAQKIEASWIGTVNSIGGQLLQRFAFEAGISPVQKILGDMEAPQLFGRVFDHLLETDTPLYQRLEDIQSRFGSKYNTWSGTNRDWQSIVKDIVAQARSNNMSENELKISAEKSIETIRQWLPQPSKQTTEYFKQHMLSLIEKADQCIEQNNPGKLNKTTITYKKFLAEMTKKEFWEWNDWSKLSTENSGKTMEKGHSEFAELREFARSHTAHPKFQQDLVEWIDLVFKMSEKAITAYNLAKQEWGLVDFIDQEAETLRLLDHEEVQEQLRENLDLLIVDEFQDTSPLQLAIFLKLSSLAKRSLWVGDIKQSIYSFRGADAELMVNVLRDQFVINGKTLDQSWRSRPGLVDFFNALFVPVFETSHQIPAEEVQLNATRKPENLLDTALQAWILPEKKSHPLDALANRIQEILRKPEQIQDKADNSYRDVRYEDIAVLCDKNQTCAEVARSLKKIGLPVIVSLETNFLGLPEIALVIASLKLMIDKSDTLAVAELIALTTDNPTQESWLEDRLAYCRENDKESEDQWMRSDPLIRKIEEFRGSLRKYSPSELLDVLMERLDIRRLVAKWGNIHQRLENLEMLRGIARDYESQCSQTGDAVTLTGMIRWLLTLTDFRHDPVHGHVPAIHVITYHASKGLEWPIVIAYNLDREDNFILRDAVLVESNGFSMEAPLENRWIFHCPWPYGALKKNTGTYQEKMEQSLIFSRNREVSYKEYIRLLYVGLTRARDFLILTMLEKNKKNLLWINNAYPDEPLQWTESEDIETLNLNQQKLSVKTIRVDAQPSTEQAQNIIWVSERQGPVIDGKPSTLNPSRTSVIQFTPEQKSALHLPHSGLWTIGKTLFIGNSVIIKKSKADPKAPILGNVLHHFFAADHMGLERKTRIEMLQGLLKRFDVHGYMEPENVVDYTNAFYAFIQQTFQPSEMIRESPLACQLEDQVISGVGDLFLKTNQGWIIIDHKSDHHPRDEQASKYGLQLHIYSQILSQATNLPCIGTWIHYATSGKLVEVVVNGNASDPEEHPWEEIENHLRENAAHEIYDLVCFMKQQQLPVPEVECYIGDDEEVFALFHWPEHKIAFLEDEELSKANILQQTGWKIHDLAGILSNPDLCLTMFI